MASSRGFLNIQSLNEPSRTRIRFGLPHDRRGASLPSQESAVSCLLRGHSIPHPRPGAGPSRSAGEAIHHEPKTRHPSPFLRTPSAPAAATQPYAPISLQSARQNRQNRQNRPCASREALRGASGFVRGRRDSSEAVGIRQRPSGFVRGRRDSSEAVVRIQSSAMPDSVMRNSRRRAASMAAEKASRCCAVKPPPCCLR